MKKLFEILSKKIYLSLFFLVLTANVWAAGSGVVIPPDTGLSTATIPDILAGIVKWLLLVFGIVAIISFIVAGIMYITATGDEKQQETAKKHMTYSIIGVIVGLSGYIVLKAVDSWLRGGYSF